MRLSDITVEVRNRALQRVGMIRPEDLNLQAALLFNNVGTWTLQLASNHPMASTLRAPGSGLIVTGPQDVMFSGPMTQPIFTADKANPKGSLVVNGVTDEVVLADMLSYPDPTNVNPTTQTLSHDTRTGPAESVIHGYVNANCGPGAPAARRKAGLIMGANLGRGGNVTVNARFPGLGTLIGTIADANGLGFRIVQRGGNIVFETFPVQDRSGEIRLDIWNNTLAAQSVAITPPGTTQVLIAGQGEQVDRTFYAATSPEALQAEADWGRRIERFVDQRQTDDVTEYAQTAAAILAAEGFTGVAVQMTPMDDTTMVYGRDWGLGDKVAVQTDLEELVALATGLALIVDKDGFRTGVTLGDPSQLDPTIAATAQLDSTVRRLNALERV